ncbi:concanavalin A-like lectin/glucanase domain-containing protein [Scheffersomyces amazonensis]|uniref:concanavalin A-like lectin/glucanase domain-containing protein n=1 Tax=Scheffersomyces amazonensis TaxID=1078765 RepID=UPI00315DE998
MKFQTVFNSIALCASLSWAILPNVPPPPAEGYDETDHHHDLPGPLSLPNLLELEDFSVLQKSWTSLGNLRLDTGRLIVDATPDGFGSVWSVESLKGSANEWTVELVFRSSGVHQDVEYGDTNGISLFLIDPQNSIPIDSTNTQNYGGPLQFDGFQFLINNKESKGLKIFNNDGSKAIQNDIASSIGHCSFNFLDSQVPFTLRISYSAQKKWFKVQIDNNLCFKTDQIQIPDSINDFKMGISASSQSNEIYEILKFNVYDHLTTDAIDDHGLISDGHVVAYETVTKHEAADSPAATGADYVRPDVIRESLLEKSRQLREQLIQEELELVTEARKGNNDHYETILKDILAHLENIQIRIESLDKSEDYDFKALVSKLQDISSIQHQQQEQIGRLESDISTFKNMITQNFGEMIGVVTKLNEKVIGEVREQHSGTEEVSKKVDLLMRNHKEIAYQYQKQTSESSAHTTDVSRYLDFTVKWILIPVVIIVIVLVVVVNRLRKEVKHSKML